MIGNNCTACCPVSAAQSINDFKSPKSPVPQLPSERMENNGIAHPAIFWGGRLKNTSVSIGRYVSPLIRGWMWKVRFGRPSHSSTAPVSALTATNLYSKDGGRLEASSVRCHTFGATSCIRIGRNQSQLPKALQLPLMARACFLCDRPGQRARKVTQLPTPSGSLLGRERG